MGNFFASLTADVACDALRGAGFNYSPEEIGIERREQRWAVSLPDDRIGWFAASNIGAERLAVERRVLRLLAERCTFQAPRLIYTSASGFDVRHMVPGRDDPWGLFERCKAGPALAKTIGGTLGGILAQQHTRIHAVDVHGWLRTRLGWPEPGAWMRERLPFVVDDAALARAMEDVIDRYEAVKIEADDRVLVHGDFGLHNLALDPRTDAVNGVFDYDGAGWADRHHDFRYLIFDLGREDMLNAALAVYEPAAGRSIDRSRVCLYNAACGICYLAFRMGTQPDQKSCGRTLAEDLRWVRNALAKLE